MERGRTLIWIWGKGHLRNNPLELQRALEVLQAVLYIEAYPIEWNLRYGEILEIGQRVDAILELQYSGNNIKRLGIEIVSSDNRDRKKASDKLALMRDLGKIHKGYVYIRSLEDVQKKVTMIIKDLIEVK
jgi:hypothetical protein